METAPDGAVVCLHGDLGAGKTALARAMIRHVMHDGDLEVPSPTYTLVQTYETQSGDIWHFDLYRLKQAEEIYELGWEEALSAALCLIEWPERLGRLKPKKTVDITIDVLPDKTRRITVDL